LKAELARKRKKLEELRRGREARGQTTEVRWRFLPTSIDFFFLTSSQPIIHHNPEVDSIVDQIIRGKKVNLLGVWC
jgi:hypothetical protein